MADLQMALPCGILTLSMSIHSVCWLSIYLIITTLDLQMSSEDSSVRRRAGAGTHEGETEEIVSSSHDFRIHNFRSPTWCDHCGDLIYGLFRQGCKCADCGIATHHHCRDQVFMFCGTPPEGNEGVAMATGVGLGGFC